LIGSCGVRKEKPNDRKGELGFEIAPDFWGQGYASEAARAMLGFAFGEMRLHRIFAACLAANRAAGRVAEKAGMKLEARLRHNEWIKGQWHDTLIYGILEQEFQDRLRQAGSIWT
jgi:[ribosomal protein S5]-alanine N-acetyltransferase